MADLTNYFSLIITFENIVLSNFYTQTILNLLNNYIDILLFNNIFTRIKTSISNFSSISRNNIFLLLFCSVNIKKVSIPVVTHCAF